MLRAIQLNPSDEHAHEAYSIFLVTTTRDRAWAVSEMRLALDLDPLSAYVNAVMAWTYVFVKDYERATEQALKTLELFPESLLAWWGLGLAEMCRSRHAEAIRAFEKPVAISPEPLSIAYLGAAQARAGRIDVAEALLRQLLLRCERQSVPPRCFVFTPRPEIKIGRSSGWRKPTRFGTQAFSGSGLCPSMIRCVQLHGSRKCSAESGSDPIDAALDLRRSIQHLYAAAETGRAQGKTLHSQVEQPVGNMCDRRFNR